MEAQRMDLLEGDDSSLLAWAEIRANSAVVTALEGAGGTDITGLADQGVQEDFINVIENGGW